MTKVMVRDITAMVNFYQTALAADVLDQSDASACLAIDENILVFVETGEGGSQQISIQYDDEQTLSRAEESLASAVKYRMSQYQQNNQVSRKITFVDIEGNDVSLLYHQVFVPETLDVD